MLRINALARRYKLKHQIAILVVDYLQLIDPENPKESRERQVAMISRRLKTLAGELQIPVLALCQLNRKLEERHDHRPHLCDLRDSGAIEQDADAVLLMWRPEDPKDDLDVISIDIAKHRNGRIGLADLIFRKGCVRFENFSP
jgi:replicative DNA helicase